MDRKKETTPRNRKKKTVTAKRITDLRESYGLTQIELAEKLSEKTKISAGLIKRLETGDRALTPEKLKVYADFFQCYPEYITGESEYRDRAEELAAALPEEDRVNIEGRTAVWRAAEQWIRASLTGADLKELEEQGRLDLFGLFCEITEPIQEIIHQLKE